MSSDLLVPIRTTPVAPFTLSMHAAAHRASFRPDIEGLRGVAILLVIAYHAEVPGAGGGYVGVDVFFVLSGYLITGLLLREKAATGRIDLVRFYARRARRLLPAAVLVTLATLLAGWFVYAPMEQRNVANTAVATSAYASNLWFAFLSTDYLAAASHTNPLLHTWSLAVEEQFYLVWPVLVLLCTRKRPHGAARGRLAAVTGFAAAVSFAGALWLSGVARPWAFFASPTRAWEFAIGALGVLLASGYGRLGARFRSAVGWAGLAAVAVAVVTFGGTTPHPGVPTLLPTAGTALVLMWGAADPSHGAGRLLHASPLQAIGRVSYSWYLWHWPVLVLAEAVMGDRGLPLRLACVVLSLALAAVTLAVLENPVRMSRVLAARPLATLAGAAALTIGGVAAGAVARTAAVRMQATPAQAAFTRASQDLPDRVLWASGCHLPYFKTQAPECAFADTASPTTVVLFGDSHAAQWFPALERLAREDRLRLVSLTKSGCAAADVRPPAEMNGISKACVEWRRAAVQRIVALMPAAVVMGSASRHIDRAHGGEAHTGISAEEWREGTRRTLSAFSRAGIPVALLRDTPWPGVHVPHCLARQAWTESWMRPRPCTFPRETPLDTLVAGLEAQAAHGIAGIRLVDLSGEVCDTSPCRPARGDTVIFQDTNHLTGTFSASLAPALRQRLDGLIPRPAAEPETRAAGAERPSPDR
jgi:peptidoglycan/LPS O-acetylase OafA/YrhL